MVTGEGLADPENLEDLAGGRTNAFIALREGWTSKEAIDRIKKGIGEIYTIFSDYPRDSVLRINEDGTAEYLAVWGWLSASNRALTFDTSGNTISKLRGMRYDFSSLLGLHKIMPGRQATMARYAAIGTQFTSAVDKNKADLATRTEGIEVYLEGPEGLALNGKKATPVQIKGDEKFLTGANVTVLQVLAHYLGANALVSYVQASPAKATPVVITPIT